MITNKTKLDRISKGICWACAKRPLKPGNKKCKTCLEKNKQWCKKYIQKNKAAGICCTCGVASICKNSIVNCKACMDIISKRCKDKRNIRKANNICKDCGKCPPEDGKKSCRKCLNKHNIRKKANRVRKTLLIKEKYGNKCSCCEESQKEFLTIDQINGNGGELRRSGLHKAGDTFHNWIIKNNFPDSLQLLCWNCNLGKYHSGNNICPHKMEEV